MAVYTASLSFKDIFIRVYSSYMLDAAMTSGVQAILGIFCGCLTASLRITFALMHLPDAFIRSHLHCIEGTVYAFDQFSHSLGIKPMSLDSQYDKLL